MQIGIVADDLTGAADAVAPFARRDFRSDVACVFRGKLSVEMPPCDARAWDTETRELPSERSIAIARLTRAATRRLKVFDPLLFYKKIDSTLRGHLRLELDAMRRELPDRLAIVCPAFPANGRTVENGIVRVHGSPLPVSVQAAFQSEANENAAELPLAMIREGAEAVYAAFAQMAVQGIATVFCDAVTQSDLEVLAQVILRTPSRFLPVGSAGLSAALAGSLEGYPVDEPANEFAPDKDTKSACADSPHPLSIPDIFTTGRILVVVGSLNPVSRKQAAYLAERAGHQVACMEMNPPPRWHSSWTRYKESIEILLSQWTSEQRIGLLTPPENTAIPHAEQSLMCAATWLTYWHIQTIEGFIFTGGGTAIQFLERFGARGVQIAGEMEPGIVRGILVADRERFHGLPIITKAGGFGTDETLARCVGLA